MPYLTFEPSEVSLCLDLSVHRPLKAVPSTCYLSQQPSVNLCSGNQHIEPAASLNTITGNMKLTSLGVARVPNDLGIGVLTIEIHRRPQLELEKSQYLLHVLTEEMVNARKAHYEI